MLAVYDVRWDQIHFTSPDRLVTCRTRVLTNSKASARRFIRHEYTNSCLNILHVTKERDRWTEEIGLPLAIDRAHVSYRLTEDYQLAEK